MSLNGISTLATKQLRQIGKLDLAASDRAADGNPRAFYDITQLPTQYSGNDILDNSNTGGLIEGRPWIAVSYSIGTIPSSINEGVAGTINVTTVGVSDGTTLYWTINNVTTSDGDFTATSGSFTITSNAGSFTITPTADVTTEGAETFTVQIRTGSTSGTVVATTSSITVNDTSITSPFVQSSLVFNLLTAPSSGSVWTEDTNNGYNGTVYKTGTGSATYTSSNGGGLTLGPSNATNMAIIGTTYTLPTTNWSVEMVVDTQPTGYWAALFGSDSYIAGRGHLAYWGAATGTNAFTVGSPTKTNLYNTTNIPATGLKHIVVTVASNTLKLYVNGTLITPTTTNYNASPASTGSALQFGSRHPNAGTANTPFDATPGTYYQMRVYSKALSQAEVTTNYTASKTYTSGLP
jgi:hypothetical protein